MNLLDQIKQILEKANQYDDLDKEIKTTNFIDKSTNKKYNSLEEAFREGVKDLSNFEEIEETTNPKKELSKMIKGDVLRSQDIEIVEEFYKLVQSLDSDKEYKKHYNRLQNKKNKAKNQGNEKKVEEINKEIENLNKKFGKTVRRKKK